MEGEVIELVLSDDPNSQEPALCLWSNNAHSFLELYSVPLLISHLVSFSRVGEFGH